MDRQVELENVQYSTELSLSDLKRLVSSNRKDDRDEAAARIASTAVTGFGQQVQVFRRWEAYLWEIACGTKTVEIKDLQSELQLLRQKSTEKDQQAKVKIRLLHEELQRTKRSLEELTGQGSRYESQRRPRRTRR